MNGEARVTKIRVFDETWDVPRGFGATYRRVIRGHRTLIAAGDLGRLSSEVIDGLGLIGYHVTPEQVSSWDLHRRVEAVVYAVTEHARASDNPVPRHPRPSWLPEHPWQGPERGEGVLAGPSGTQLRSCERGAHRFNAYGFCRDCGAKRRAQP